MMRTAAPASLPLAVQVAGLRHADGISDTSDGRAAVLEQLVAEMMPAALDHADGISDTSDGRAAVLEQLVAEMMPAALDVRRW